MREIRSEHGRWVKQGGLSEVGKGVDETPTDEGSTCLVCKAAELETPGVRKALVNSWREDTGEENIFVMAVCERHRGQWWFYPNGMTKVMDAQHRLN